MTKLKRMAIAVLTTLVLALWSVGAHAAVPAEYVKFTAGAEANVRSVCQKLEDMKELVARAFKPEKIDLNAYRAYFAEPNNTCIVTPVPMSYTVVKAVFYVKTQFDDKKMVVVVYELKALIGESTWYSIHIVPLSAN